MTGSMSGSATDSMQSSMPGSAPDSMSTQPAAETPLVPVQISPQRLQSIGVENGREFKENSLTTKFTPPATSRWTKPAWRMFKLAFPVVIKTGFADATYQYVHKGQPLLTIYSPDLVATNGNIWWLWVKSAFHGPQHGAGRGFQRRILARRHHGGRLKKMGVPPRQIARLESTGQVQQQLEVDSPVSGYITERNAFPSVAVQPEYAPLHHH